MDSRTGEFVQSLERGLSVIGCFSREHSALTLSEVARLTGQTRATARRVLLTLEELGFARSDGRVFSLTPKVLDLGYAYLSALDLADFAQPEMERLVEQTHESCSAAVLDGPEIVYVVRVPTTRIMSVSIGLGSRLPAVATSLGRALLAELEPPELDRYLAATPFPALTRHTITTPGRLAAEIARVRAQGWALVDQELEEGIRSVATVLRGRNGVAVAALNVSTPAGRVTLRELRESILPCLLDTAARINDRLARR